MGDVNEIIEPLTEEEQRLLEQPPQDVPSEDGGESGLSESSEGGVDETAETVADDEVQDQTDASGEEGAEDEGEDGGKKRKTVPLKALHEEREKRKRLQEELQKQKEMMARLEERTRLILEQFRKQPEQQQREQPPSPDEDPLGYLEHLGKEVSELRQMTEQERMQLQQQQKLQQMLAIGEQQAAQYREQVGPDIYDKAFQHVVESRSRELKSFGLDDMQVQQQLQAELVNGMIMALQQGKNPGELLMEYARARGFNHDAVKAGEAVEATNDKARRIADGQKKTRGLGSGGKGVPDFDIKRLAEMSQEEFEEAIKGKSLDAILRKAI